MKFVFLSCLLLAGCASTEMSSDQYNDCYEESASLTLLCFENRIKRGDPAPQDIIYSQCANFGVQAAESCYIVRKPRKNRT